MRTALRLLLLLALVATVAVPVAAEEPEPPTLRTERTYFSCGDANKARLVNGLQGDYDSWDTEAPTTSFQAGAGCGTSSMFLTDPELNGTWEGTFTGNLDSIAVEIHIIDVGLSRVPGEPYGVIPTLEIDGEERALQMDEFYLLLDTERSETNITVKGLMTITGLDLAEEPGDGEIERSIRLSLAGTEFDSGAFVWDATEVPSGLTFNPETPQGTRIPAL